MEKISLRKCFKHALDEKEANAQMKEEKKVPKYLLHG